MKQFSNILACCSVMVFLPGIANAVGTYYTKGANQQRSYTKYTNIPRATVPTPTVATNAYQTVKTVKQPVNAQKSTDVKQGFYIGADFSHEFASWKFDMATAGSMLHYDNIGWNVFGANAGYKFATNVPFQIDGGFRYGMQSGESTMVDDDITNGGYYLFDTPVEVEIDGVPYVVDPVNNSLSVGTTKGGKMTEFFAGVGLTDVFKIGNLNFTPSVGYRYLKYKLHTEDNYGMQITVLYEACNNEFGVQCEPAIVELEDGSISTLDTFYYHQPSVSHSYDVLWSGPYVAMDMRYDINQNNFANARVELGFPGYESTGDQPYRIDLQHPTSFKDKADMFHAFHLGLSADWMTALTDSVSLSLGVTYDYYSVKKADATTYLNAANCEAEYLRLEALGYTDVVGEENYNYTMSLINFYRSNGWQDTVKEEIKSIYKSLGVRLGLSVRF